MKRYLLKIVLFFALIAVIDLLLGEAFGLLRREARGGQTYKNEYLYNDFKDYILILGSSKADHHYVPSIIEDSLGRSCYNAGEMGCGIITAYARYRMVSARHKPKLVLYEVTPGYDYLLDDGYSSYLGVIRPYTGDKNVADVYLAFSDKLESIRLMSSLYRNNSKIVSYLKDMYAQSDYYKGYEPLYGELNPNISKTATAREATISIDSLKLSYMMRMAEETRSDGVQLVFIISPTYSGICSNSYSPIIDLCDREHIPLINNINCASFVGNNKYFQDGLHLNHKGATEYSKIVSNQIREFF